jgi:hypothetical protein
MIAPSAIMAPPPALEANPSFTGTIYIANIAQVNEGFSSRADGVIIGHTDGVFIGDDGAIYHLPKDVS